MCVWSYKLIIYERIITHFFNLSRQIYNMKYTIEKIAGIDCIFAPLEWTAVTIEIMCKAGSVYEEKHSNGISHFLEHMFFKWWEKYPTPQAVAEAVDKFWWEFNAYTSDEYAGYYVKCGPQLINKAIDVLWDMMMQSKFGVEEIEREKGVVVQEVRMYEDNPMALVAQKWQERYFGNNSYGRDIGGPVENINSFTQDMLFEHKNNLYTKDNLIIVISGKIEDKQSIEDQISTIFADLPEHKKVTKPAYPENHLPTEQSAFLDKKAEQNHIIMAFPGFDGNDPKRYAASILATYMWGNMSSRLFQNIREKEGLCYYIMARHSSSQNHGELIIRAGMDKTRFDFGIEKIYEEIEAIANGSMTQQDFENAIGYTEWQIQMWIETSDDMASFLWSQYLLYGEIKTLDDVLSEYKKVTLADVQAIAKTLTKDNSKLYWIQ